jgi:catechol 2,3-dioxygenase-like lactoylglutathione lyase family enzyme
MLDCLDHVILAVRDLEATTRAMARLLGRSPSWRGEHPVAGTANTLFRVENTTLELLAPLGAGPEADALGAWLDTRGEGMLGLAFGTGDADACHAFFSERGLEPDPVEKGLGRDVESGAFREWRRVSLPLARTRGVLLFAIQHGSPDLLPESPILGDESAAVAGLDHTVVMTPDADATKALYGDGLGLRLALDREFPDWGARLLFFRVGDITVEIGARLGEGDDKSPDTDRLWGLSWRVRSAEAARARLLEADFDVSDVRDGRKPGTRVLTVRSGTCGVPTLLIEPASR